MNSPRVFCQGVGTRLLVLCTLVSFGAGTACSGTESSGDASLVVEVVQDEITVENQTGSPLMKGEVSVIPYGTAPRPYVMLLPHMSAGEKRAFALSSFRDPSGTRFMRSVANGHRVKVRAIDVAGKTHERDVPFN